MFICSRTMPLKNIKMVEKTVKTEGAQVDLDWKWKGELFVAQKAHATSGHLGRDATYRWERGGPDHGNYHAGHP